MSGTDMDFDVIVIGGGAAGLCAAVRLKQLLPKSSVAVLEQLPRVGKKLIITGNGRCNITNRSIEPYRYHGQHRDFCIPALQKYSGKPTEDFFKRLGVEIIYDETGRAYPRSLQASSVVDALRFAADENGVEIFCDCRLTDFKACRGGYSVDCSDRKLTAQYIIIAAGMYSGGEKTGSSGAIFRLLKQKGYPTVSPAPAIVQLKTDPNAVRPLKGIKVNAAASLKRGDKTLRKEFGEVLFCDYGLSGPPILQLSRKAGRGESGLCVSLDLMPEYTAEQLVKLLIHRIETLKKRPPEEFFTGMLNKRVGQTLLRRCGISEKISEKDAPTLAEIIADWRFTVLGTTGFINSQVTSGGLDTSAFNAETMESIKNRGLFAAGEILDIDGDCGGFNLQWAWSSALSAADEIAQRG